MIVTSRERPPAPAPTPAAPPRGIPSSNAGEGLPARRQIPWTGLALALALGGLLAVLALPDSHALARQLETERVERSLCRGLAALRTAVGAYHNEHGAWPGADPEPRTDERRPLHTSGWFARQLLSHSDAAGHCTAGVSPSHPFGPYMAELPTNPVNGRNDVRVLRPSQAMPELPDGLSAWIYDPLAGELRANCTGTTQQGEVRFFDL